tara:strand:- start:131 stop:571 length:441 start_codon:yes stop_codon:yes gene_type:complete
MDENIDDSVYDIIKVYLAQMDSAIKISEIICKHSDHEELTGDDIICGLIYRLMRPMSNEEITKSLTSADDILNSLNESDDEDEDDIVEYEDPKVSRKIKSNHCNCEICSDVRVCLLNYNDYIPNDTLADRFKNSIQTTCGKYKIYI